MLHETGPVESTADDVTLIDPQAVYRRNPQVRVRNVAGTLVLRSGSRLLELESAAATLWRALDGLVPFDELHRLLSTDRHAASMDRAGALELLAERVDAGAVLAGPSRFQIAESP